jgi:endonuclease YncB( thermonuclease family)
MSRRKGNRRRRTRRVLSRRRIGSAIGYVAAVVIYVGVFEPLRREIWPESAFQGRVTHVVDGDTFHVAGIAPAIRLWGVDAPEKDQEGYFDAGAALSKFTKGRTLACEIVDRDRYGRAVARCEREDGEDVSRLMIESGAAAEYWRYTHGRYTIERWLEDNTKLR